MDDEIDHRATDCGGERFPPNMAKHVVIFVADHRPFVRSGRSDALDRSTDVLIDTTCCCCQSLHESCWPVRVEPSTVGRPGLARRRRQVSRARVRLASPTVCYVTPVETSDTAALVYLLTGNT